MQVPHSGGLVSIACGGTVNILTSQLRMKLFNSASIAGSLNLGIGFGGFTKRNILATPDNHQSFYSKHFLEENWQETHTSKGIVHQSIGVL